MLHAVTNRAAAAPSPPGGLILGHLRPAIRDPLGFSVGCMQQHGDVVALRFGIYRSHLIAHPDAIKHVLQDNNRRYRKSANYTKLERLLGRGLFTNEGESWLRQRRLAAPAFHRHALADAARQITDATAAMLRRWDGAGPGATLDVAAEMQRLTLDITGRALFGADVEGFAEPVIESLQVAIDYITRACQEPVDLPAWLPTPAGRRFRRAVRALDAITFAMIAARRREHAAGRPGGDLLALLLAAQDADTGAGMTDRQLRDEVMTLYLAGTETSANALAWIWHLLDRHPEVRERLAAELDDVLGGRVPELADVPRLAYTAMVVDEALRLYPPAWGLGRVAVEDDVIGGYRIPRGTSVIISPYVTHRHPSFWERPERFEPGRFDPGRAAERHRFAYLPFGGGPHLCIGRDLALLEIKLVVAQVAQARRLTLAPGHAVVPAPLLTLRPRGGLPMVVSGR